MTPERAVQRRRRVLSGWILCFLDNADQVLFLRNEHVDFVKGVYSRSDLADHTYAHAERSCEASHNVEVVRFVRDHEHLLWNAIGLLVREQPVLATDVEPSHAWNFATHHTCVAAVEPAHSDMCALGHTANVLRLGRNPRARGSIQWLESSAIIVLSRAGWIGASRRNNLATCEFRSC
jgi:hypothetical protein